MSGRPPKRGAAAGVVDHFADDHPLLTGRHVDKLVEVTSAHTRQLVKNEEQRQRDHRESIRLQESLLQVGRDQLAVMKQLAEHTSGIPALLELLVTKVTNGQGNTDVADVKTH